MILVKKFSFEAAHNLTKYHGKCEKLHGHTYRLVVKIEGPLNEEEMVMDFAELKKSSKSWLFLNSITRISTTCSTSPPRKE